LIVKVPLDFLPHILLDLDVEGVSWSVVATEARRDGLLHSLVRRSPRHVPLR